MKKLRTHDLICHIILRGSLINEFFKEESRKNVLQREGPTAPPEGRATGVLEICSECHKVTTASGFRKKASQRFTS
jgi:hypothetical protein